jgi:NAD(P)-dependent dehydrogenase (short-subunit alcohol dehydrogenase family)
MRVEGVVALVTGGLSGLGLATVQRLAKDGASVVIVGRPRPDAPRIAGDIAGDVRFVAADVTHEDELRAALDVAEGLGPLRIAVNCAGIGTPGRLRGGRGPLALDVFRQVLEVNLVGTVNLVRLAADRMAGNEPLDGDRGVLVCTSSIAAFDGQIGQVAYAASKAGIVGLTLPAARELAQYGIRLVTIAPGIFQTPILSAVPDPVLATLAQQTPHPSRLGRPEEFAALVAHVVENPMLNGATIRLDGAIRMPFR